MTTRRKGTKRLKAPAGEGSIVQRPDGRWAARYTPQDPDPSRKDPRQWMYGKTEQEVRAKLLDALKRDKEGSPALKGRRTLESWVADWLEHQAGQVRPLTLHRYGELLEKVTASLGKVQLDRLTVDQVEALMLKIRREGRSARTCNHTRAVLRNCLGDAVKRYGLARNVAELADPLPLTDSKDSEVLTSDQVVELLALAETHPDGVAWTVALATGARQSELLALRWSDVNFDNCSLRIDRTLQRDPDHPGRFLILPTKTRRSTREVPLPSVACEALKRHRREQAEARLAAGKDWSTEHDDLVFSDRGEPLIGGNLTNRMQRAFASHELPPIRFHDLRHSAATFMALAGVPVAVAMGILGHSTSAMTLDVYTSVRGADSLREGSDALDRVMRG